MSSGSIKFPGRGLAIKTIREHGLVLKNVFKQAVIEGIIEKSPAENIPIPKQKYKLNKANFLNVEQANNLLKCFKNHELSPLICTTLYYGFRRSEVLGLKWDAIDFENDTIEIKHTVVLGCSIVAKDRTKTESSRRKYVLLPEVKKILQKIQEEQQKHSENFGNQYIQNDYIFK